MAGGSLKGDGGTSVISGEHWCVERLMAALVLNTHLNYQ